MERAVTVQAFQSGNADRYMIPPQPTVGIVTTVGSYERYVHQWCLGVRGLQRKPDKVVIAASDPDAVRAVTDKELPIAEVVGVEEEFLLSRYLNRAIEACDTEWIAWIGVDDRYRPQALNGIDIIDTDVYIFGMQIAGRGVWQGGHVSEALSHNSIPCGSPFRRWIWEAIPFQEDLAPFEDWAFWAGAAALGATSKQTGRIDFDYAQHGDQIVPPAEPTSSLIREWAASL